MSTWPLVSDFSAMLQNPRFAFRRPELRECTFEKNAIGQPRPWSGNFATVYKAIFSNGDFLAVRVFNRAARERRERYDEISDYLQQHKPDCVVDFEYHSEGIRSVRDGKMYPLVTMEWIAGDTLFQWLERNCHAGRSDRLLRAADEWVDLIASLRAYGIAHGDLQHANVMVTPRDEMKLVDYDCMCVPALFGRENLELGVKPYQHPSRNAHTRLSKELDNFSALLIFVSLRALAAEPGLWIPHVKQPSYDKMLFHRADLANPTRSALLKDLARSPDPLVPELAQVLVDCYRAPMDDVPPLSMLLDGRRRSRIATPIARTREVEQPPEPVRSARPPRPGRPIDSVKANAPLPQWCNDSWGSIANDWYFVLGRKEYGPVSFGLLTHFAEQGRISPETRVRKGARGDWVAARHVRGLIKTRQ